MEKYEIIVLGGGCFWCTEAVYLKLKGVIKVTPGYAGGISDNPTYEEVSSGTSGHAEVIEVIYDPSIISARDILEVFFATHDPFTLNRQGNDVGIQYRSVIFYTNEQQKDVSLSLISELNKTVSTGGKVVTEVSPLKQFFKAEPYHVDYYNRNKEQPYCQLVINPKLKKFKEKFKSLIKD